MLVPEVATVEMLWFESNIDACFFILFKIKLGDCLVFSLLILVILRLSWGLFLILQHKSENQNVMFTYISQCLFDLHSSLRDGSLNSSHISTHFWDSHNFLSLSFLTFDCSNIFHGELWEFVRKQLNLLSYYS